MDEPEDALASAGAPGAVGADEALPCRVPSWRPCGGGSSGQANIMAVLTAEASSGRACAEFAAACASEAFALPPAAACNMSAACIYEKPHTTLHQNRSQWTHEYLKALHSLTS